MKILIAYTASGTSDNPFVRLLADGIRACGYEVVCSVEEFRSNAASSSSLGMPRKDWRKM